jgi:hypothetical protein
MVQTRRCQVLVFLPDTARYQVLVVRPSAHRSAGPASLANPPTRSLRVSVHSQAIVRHQPGSVY